jgi:hypothetical protein
MLRALHAAKCRNSHMKESEPIGTLYRPTGRPEFSSVEVS